MARDRDFPFQGHSANISVMVIASYNVNGIRAAMRKGFVDWARASGSDIICLQEIRAGVNQIDTRSLEEAGWHCNFFPAEKAGYAGTGILSRSKPENVLVLRDGNGVPLPDNEGRVIGARIDGVAVYSVYVPSGSSGDSRQEFKMNWLEKFLDFSGRVAADGEEVVFCGDFNICHREIDIHDPRGLSGTSGFLPTERAWMDKWFSQGFRDSFREANPGVTQYSWWSMRGRAREKNLGWRIDYAAPCGRMVARMRRAWIDDSAPCSDHCPTLVELS